MDSDSRDDTRSATTIARAITGRSAWLVALVGLLLGLLVIGAVGQNERERGAIDSLPAGLDSTRGTELREQIPEDDGSVAVVVFTVADRFDGRQIAAIEALARTAGAIATGETGVVQVADDRSAALAIVPVAATSASDNADRRSSSWWHSGSTTTSSWSPARARRPASTARAGGCCGR